MSWLLFLDESGHDHKTTPYEVHGGVAIHATKLWPFISAVRTLEQSMFGAYLQQIQLRIEGLQAAGQGPLQVGGAGGQDG